MKRIIYALSALALVACSDIAENERFVEVPLPVISSSQRHVLIEDFTGQSCVSCPDAAVIIHELQEQFGSDAVVAVGIYCGPFGQPKGTAVSLVTDLGETYWNHWFDNNTSQPIGIINRQPAMKKEEWKGAVLKALSDSTQMELSVSDSNFDAATREYSLTVQVKDESLSEGNLQVWLIENGFIGYQQYKLNGIPKTNRNYEHNHVLRASMNGDWGEKISLGSSESTSRTYKLTLSEDWNADNMEAVIFVYTNKGVEQVITSSVKNQF